MVDRLRCPVIEMAIARAIKNKLDVNLDVLDECEFQGECGVGGQCPRYEKLMTEPQYISLGIGSQAARPVDSKSRFYNRLQKWAERNPGAISNQPSSEPKPTGWF